jgi:hypothetical protein
MKTYLLATGLAAIAAATSATKIAGFVPLTTMTVPEGSLVYTGTLAEMQVVHNNLSEAIIKCVLDAAQGDFSVGNMVLYLTGGIPYCCCVLDIEHFKMKTTGVCAGGWLELQVMFRDPNLFNFFDFTNIAYKPASMNLAPSEYSLVDISASLPEFTVVNKQVLNDRMGLIYSRSGTGIDGGGLWGWPLMQRLDDASGAGFWEIDGGTDGVDNHKYVYP